jgi:hypothetical protein
MSSTDSRKPTPTRLDDEQKSAVAALVNRLGILAASGVLGVHPQTVARLAAGFSGHRSVVALVEHRLADLVALEDARQEAASEPKETASETDPTNHLARHDGGA